MRAGADLRRGTVPDLPEEFTGPVPYAHPWGWIALGLVALAVAYLAFVWWTTRAPRVLVETPLAPDVATLRRRFLGDIDGVAAGVADGSLDARSAHQRLSVLVRTYVEAVSPLPATAMALADFRSRAPEPLVAALELMYPPEFGPDPAPAADLLPQALERARAIVEAWG